MRILLQHSLYHPLTPFLFYFLLIMQAFTLALNRSIMPSSTSSYNTIIYLLVVRIRIWTNCELLKKFLSMKYLLSKLGTHTHTQVTNFFCKCNKCIFFIEKTRYSYKLNIFYIACSNCQTQNQHFSRNQNSRTKGTWLLRLAVRYYPSPSTVAFCLWTTRHSCNYLPFVPDMLTFTHIYSIVMQH